MSTLDLPVPILGFAAFSGTGKTTLLRRLIPLLKGEGLRLAMVKHAHHSFEVDYPGKDSYELRKCGAEQVLVASRQRWALMVERPVSGEPRLAELLAHIDAESCDLVLVEGFKHEPIPKVEVHRPSLGHPLLCLEDESFIALATDVPEAVEPVPVPLLPLNDPAAVAAFVLRDFLGRAAT